MKPHPDDERMFRPKSANALEGLPLDLGRLPAGSQPVETSEIAASDIANLKERREKVLLWFASRGERGGTADELEESFGLGHNATSPRVTELMALKLVTRTTERRETRQGKPAFVHVITEAGWCALSRRNVEAA